jgi:hypothetical protein
VQPTLLAQFEHMATRRASDNAMPHNKQLQRTVLGRHMRAAAELRR